MRNIMIDEFINFIFEIWNFKVVEKLHKIINYNFL